MRVTYKYDDNEKSYNVYTPEAENHLKILKEMSEIEIADKVYFVKNIRFLPEKSKIIVFLSEIIDELPFRRE